MRHETIVTYRYKVSKKIRDMKLFAEKTDIYEDNAAIRATNSIRVSPVPAYLRSACSI